MSRYDEICASLAAAPKRWLVTGAAGFIGSALVERLLGLGQTVVGLDNFSSGRPENLSDALRAADGHGSAQLDMIEGDICDPHCCRQACERVDFVLHHAAVASVPQSIEEPLAAHEANVSGFLQVVLAAREAGVKRVVYASSSAIYGEAPSLPATEQQVGRPLSPYAATKLADELYAYALQRSYGLELVGLRYFNIFGPRQDPAGPYAAVVPKWIQRLFAGQPGVIFGDGSQSRDFCYVADAVQANLLAALTESRGWPAVYNVGSGRRTTLAELYHRVRQAVEAAVPGLRAADPSYAPARPADIAHSQADVSLLRARLGFELGYGLGAGMTETVRWFAQKEPR